MGGSRRIFDRSTEKLFATWSSASRLEAIYWFDHNRRRTDTLRVLHSLLQWEFEYGLGQFTKVHLCVVVNTIILSLQRRFTAPSRMTPLSTRRPL